MEGPYTRRGGSARPKKRGPWDDSPGEPLPLRPQSALVNEERLKLIEERNQDRERLPPEPTHTPGPRRNRPMTFAEKKVAVEHAMEATVRHALEGVVKNNVGDAGTAAALQAPGNEAVASSVAALQADAGLAPPPETVSAVQGWKLADMLKSVDLGGAVANALTSKLKRSVERSGKAWDPSMELSFATKLSASGGSELVEGLLRDVRLHAVLAAPIADGLTQLGPTDDLGGDVSPTPPSPQRPASASPMGALAEQPKRPVSAAAVAQRPHPPPAPSPAAAPANLPGKFVDDGAGSAPPPQVAISFKVIHSQGRKAELASGRYRASLCAAFGLTEAEVTLPRLASVVEDRDMPELTRRALWGGPNAPDVVNVATYALCVIASPEEVRRISAMVEGATFADWCKWLSPATPRAAVTFSLTLESEMGVAAYEKQAPRVKRMLLANIVRAAPPKARKALQALSEDDVRFTLRAGSIEIDATIHNIDATAAAAASDATAAVLDEQARRATGEADVEDVFNAPVKEITSQPRVNPTVAPPPGADKESKPLETPKTETKNDVPALALGSLPDLMAGIDGLVGPMPGEVLAKEASGDVKGAAKALLAAMTAEHIAREDSFVPFDTGNYGVHTSSAVEFWFVVDPACVQAVQARKMTAAATGATLQKLRALIDRRINGELSEGQFEEQQSQLLLSSGGEDADEWPVEEKMRAGLSEKSKLADQLRRHELTQQQFVARKAQLDGQIADLTRRYEGGALTSKQFSEEKAKLVGEDGEVRWERRRKPRAMAEFAVEFVADSNHRSPDRPDVHLPDVKQGGRNVIDAQLAQLGQPPLSDEEFYGGRLYTGPLFEKYNGVLRGLPNRVPFFVTGYMERCLGNRYVATIHAINRCLVKLSKVTPAQKLYRGVSGMRLPDCFFEYSDATYRVSGGVEFGFMSASADKEESLKYATARTPSLLYEIDQGMLDRGASLQWLSQYPHEAETCFPPCTGLELKRTANGEADTEQTAKVKIVKMRAQPKVPDGAAPPRPPPATVTFGGCEGKTLEEAWRKAQEKKKAEAKAKEAEDKDKMAAHMKELQAPEMRRLEEERRRKEEEERRRAAEQRLREATDAREPNEGELDSAIKAAVAVRADKELVRKAEARLAKLVAAREAAAKRLDEAVQAGEVDAIFKAIEAAKTTRVAPAVVATAEKDANALFEERGKAALRVDEMTARATSEGRDGSGEIGVRSLKPLIASLEAALEKAKELHVARAEKPFSLPAQPASKDATQHASGREWKGLVIVDRGQKQLVALRAELQEKLKGQEQAARTLRKATAAATDGPATPLVFTLPAVNAPNDDTGAFHNWGTFELPAGWGLAYSGGTLAVRWKDQGWGNQKGSLSAKLAIKQKDWIPISTHVAPHQWSAETFALPAAWFDGVETQETLELAYYVGGGGGHALFVEQGATLTLQPKSSEGTEALTAAIEEAEKFDVEAPLIEAGKAKLAELAEAKRRRIALEEATKAFKSELAKFSSRAWNTTTPSTLESSMTAHAGEIAKAEAAGVDISLIQKGKDNVAYLKRVLQERREKEEERRAREAAAAKAAADAKAAAEQREREQREREQLERARAPKTVHFKGKHNNGTKIDGTITISCASGDPSGKWMAKGSYSRKTKDGSDDGSDQIWDTSDYDPSTQELTLRIPRGERKGNIGALSNLQAGASWRLGPWGLTVKSVS